MENVEIVGEAESVEQAEDMIRKLNPDLLLLDIQLGKKTGFDLLALFPNPTFEVLFITAYEQFALRAIKAGALDYLLKPLVEADFTQAIAKALTKKNKQNTGQFEVAKTSFETKEINRLTLSTNDGHHIVWIKDILYCSSNGNYTTFHLANGKNLMISKLLKEYETLLPSEVFLRVHQSFLVNMNYVEQFTKDNSLILSNNAEIIVSSRKKEEVILWLKKMA
jgi:two-component system LytT family response regulator